MAMSGNKLSKSQEFISLIEILNSMEGPDVQAAILIASDELPKIDNKCDSESKIDLISVKKEIEEGIQSNKNARVQLETAKLEKTKNQFSSLLQINEQLVASYIKLAKVGDQLLLSKDFPEEIQIIHQTLTMNDHLRHVCCSLLNAILKTKVKNRNLVINLADSLIRNIQKNIEIYGNKLISKETLLRAYAYKAVAYKEQGKLDAAHEVCEEVKKVNMVGSAPKHFELALEISKLDDLILKLRTEQNEAKEQKKLRRQEHTERENQAALNRVKTHVELTNKTIADAERFITHAIEKFSALTSEKQLNDLYLHADTSPDAKDKAEERLKEIDKALTTVEKQIHKIEECLIVLEKHDAKLDKTKMSEKDNGIINQAKIDANKLIMKYKKKVDELNIPETTAKEKINNIIAIASDTAKALRQEQIKIEKNVRGIKNLTDLLKGNLNSAEKLNDEFRYLIILAETDPKKAEGDSKVLLETINRHLDEAEKRFKEIYKEEKMVSNDIQIFQTHGISEKQRIAILSAQKNSRDYVNLATENGKKLKLIIEKAKRNQAKVIEASQKIGDSVEQKKDTIKQMTDQAVKSADLALNLTKDVYASAKKIDKQKEYVMTHPEEALTTADKNLVEARNVLAAATAQYESAKELSEDILTKQKKLSVIEGIHRDPILIPSLGKAKKELKQVKETLRMSSRELDGLRNLAKIAKKARVALEKINNAEQKLNDIIQTSEVALQNATKLVQEGKNTISEAKKMPEESTKSISKISSDLDVQAQKIENNVAKAKRQLSIIKETAKQLQELKLPEQTKVAEDKMQKAVDVLKTLEKWTVTVRELDKNANENENQVNLIAIQTIRTQEESPNISPNLPITKDEKSQSGQTYKELPDSFSTSDIDLILTPAKQASILKLHSLSAALELSGIKLSIRGSFVSQCAMHLVGQDPIPADDVDAITAITEQQFSNLAVLMAIQGFKLKEVAPDPSGRPPKFHNYIFENGDKEDPDYYKIDITVTLPNYPSKNSFPFTSFTMCFDHASTKDIRFQFDYRKFELEFYSNYRIFPVVLPNPYDKDVRGFFRVFLKWRREEKALNVYFVGEVLEKFTIEKWNKFLLDFFRKKLWSRNPKAGYDCYNEFQRTIEEGNFNLPDAEPIIKNFCIALIERTCRQSRITINDDVILASAINMTSILQTFYEKHPELAGQFIEVTRHLLMSVNNLCLKEMNEFFFLELERQFCNPKELTPPDRVDIHAPSSSSSDSKQLYNPLFFPTSSHADKKLSVSQVRQELVQFYQNAFISLERCYTIEQKSGQFKVLSQNIKDLCDQLMLCQTAGDPIMEKLFQETMRPHQIAYNMPGAHFYGASKPPIQLQAESKKNKKNQSRG